MFRTNQSKKKNQIRMCIKDIRKIWNARAFGRNRKKSGEFGKNRTGSSK